MNYKLIHDSIINKAKSRTKIEGYFEKHHIIPKCKGGTNDKYNIVNLTAREHFLIHRLLVRIYPEERCFYSAFWAMCTKHKYTIRRYIPTSREYEEAKLLMSRAIKERLREKNYWIGKKHSEKTKKKQSESAKNRKIVLENERVRRKGISEGNKNRIMSEKNRKFLSDSRKGENNPIFGKTGKNNNKSVKVSQYDMNGKFIKEWYGLSEVERIFGLKKGRLYSVLKSNSKTCAGFKWKYSKNNNVP